MSWKRGSSVFESIIEVTSNIVLDSTIRKDLYLSLIEIFEEADCDTLYELYKTTDDKAFDLAYEEINPPELDFDYED